MLRRKKLNGTLKFKPILLSAATIAASALWGGYVTDGLVLHYDAIDNAGIGKHEDNPEKWVDLTGNGADLDLTSDKIKVGANYIAFNKVKKSVAGVKDIASGEVHFTLEVVARTDESYTPTTARWRYFVYNDRIGLFLHGITSKGARGLIGFSHLKANKVHLSYKSVPSYCGDWNNLPFVRNFHTYSLKTTFGTGNVAIDGGIYYGGTAEDTSAGGKSLNDTLYVGDENCNFIFKSIRLYNRQLTEAEMRQNRMEDAVRFPNEENWRPDANTATNVFSDAVYYFRGASTGDNEPFDGTNTVENALWTGVASTLPCNKGSIEGSAANIAVETVDVKCPYSRKLLKNCRTLRFLQRSWTDADGIECASSTRYRQDINANFTNTAPYTVALRFKIESAMFPGAKITLLRLGAYGYCGLDLELKGNDDNDMYVSVTRAEKEITFKKMIGNPSLRISRGKWIDLALSVKDYETRLYYRTEDGDMYEAVNTAGGTNTDDNRIYLVRFGGVKNDGDLASKINGSFRGWIQQAAVWGRQLSRDEVLQAFRDGCGEYDAVRVGVPNGGNCEFAGTDSVSGNDGREWMNFTNAFDSAGSSVKVLFDLPSDRVSVKRDFCFATTPFYADNATFKVTLNGMTVAETMNVDAGTTAVAPVPASYFRSTGNELEILRIDEGDEKAEIDYIAITASKSADGAAGTLSAKDVYSGGAFWMRVQDRDENGWLFTSSDSESHKSTDEWRDLLSDAIPGSEKHIWLRRSNVAIPASNFVVQAATVKCPAAGIELQGEPCLKFASPSYFKADGQLVSTYGSVYRDIFPATNKVGYSVLMRIRFDGYINATNKVADLMAYGYNWTDHKGSKMYLQGDEDNMYVLMNAGATRMEFTGTQEDEEVNRLKAGSWIDIGYSVTNGVVTLYTFTEGGSLVEQTQKYGFIDQEKPSSDYSRFYVGCREVSNNGGDALNTTANPTGFRGLFHQVAVWPRALTREEMIKAMKWPRPDIFRLGVFNGLSHEFSGGDTEVTDVYRFRKVSPSIRESGESYEIEFDLNATDAAQNQLLTLGAASDSVSEASFAVTLNGKRIFNYDTERNQVVEELTVAAGGSTQFGIHRSWLNAGRNNLTLTRTDANEGTFVMDAMSFGNGGEKIRVRTRLGFFSISIR